MQEIPVLPLPSFEFRFLYSTVSVKTGFDLTWWCRQFWKRRALFEGRKREIFLPRLIHIQSSQNVKHKRSSMRCIKDQCQSAGKGQRTNRRDQLPQLCGFPHWEHIIPASQGGQPESGTCSSDQVISLCPPQSHSEKYSHISMHRSSCSLTSQHDDSWKHQCK